MTRTSKQEKRRAISPRKRQNISIKKTGPLKDNLPKGYKEHENALEGATAAAFIPKLS